MPPRDESRSFPDAEPAPSSVVGGGVETSSAQPLPPIIITPMADDSSSIVPPRVSEGRDPYLGRQFGGYELIAKVGQGGMGMVYKGRQVSLDRVVAVKILNKALCDNPEFIKRFEREAKSIARVNHPNILAVYDFGQTDGLWYMVTEFIEGSSLASQIAERLVLPWEEVAPLMAQCMTGLSFVGQSGVVHRDIKPDNILITKDGTAKIADFGLAKDVSNNDSTDLTSTGMAMGTPAYMSPEQCMGRKLDVRSDVYSLGITAYLALTGEKPFTGQSSFEIMTKQREYTPRSPRMLNANVPAPVSDLVMRMMAKEPSDRCRDGEECRLAWQNLCPRSLRDTPPAVMPNAAPEPARVPPRSLRNSGEYYPPPASTNAAADARPGQRPGMDQRSLRRASQEMRVTQEIREPLPLPTTAPETAEPKRGVTASSEIRPGSERQARPSTDRRSVQRTSVIETSTCPRCGMLNRPEAMMCSRCQNILRPESTKTKDQEARADQLTSQGNHREAAAVYAHLAERENDKRLRAILRTKEREARNREQEHVLQDLHGRSQSLVQRGDLRGGIELLERGLRDMRETGASAPQVEQAVQEELLALRSQQRTRQRVRILLFILLALAVLVLIGVLLQVRPRTVGSVESAPVPVSAKPSATSGP